VQPLGDRVRRREQHANGGGIVAGDRAGELMHARQQLRVRNDLTDEPGPQRVLGDRKSPVKLICRATRAPTAAGSSTDAPQPGTRPTRACVSAKAARSEAISRSQCRASSSPPVIATPFTAPINGVDSGAQGYPGGTPSGLRPRSRLAPVLPSSLRSSPAQNAGSPRQHDGAHLLVRVQLGEGIAQAEHERGRQRVARSRPVQRHGGNATRPLDD